MEGTYDSLRMPQTTFYKLYKSPHKTIKSSMKQSTVSLSSNFTQSKLLKSGL